MANYHVGEQRGEADDQAHDPPAFRHEPGLAAHGDLDARGRLQVNGSLLSPAKSLTHADSGRVGAHDHPHDLVLAGDLHGAYGPAGLGDVPQIDRLAVAGLHDQVLQARLAGKRDLWDHDTNGVVLRPLAVLGTHQALDQGPERGGDLVDGNPHRRRPGAVHIHAVLGLGHVHRDIHA